MSNKSSEGRIMYRDEVIEEVWRLRDTYVEEHHHNLDEIVEDLRRHQAEHPEEVVDQLSHKNVVETEPKEPR